jgi:bifunctional non-homologous end joining protein LigD
LFDRWRGYRLDGKGLAVFQFIRNYRRGNIATICAFDLIEIDGRDMRQQPIEERKHVLKWLLSKSHPALLTIGTLTSKALSSFTMRASSAAKASCPSGSVRLSGRSRDWVKVKNPASPPITLMVPRIFCCGAKLPSQHRLLQGYET